MGRAGARARRLGVHLRRPVDLDRPHSLPAASCQLCDRVVGRSSSRWRPRLRLPRNLHRRRRCSLTSRPRRTTRLRRSCFRASSTRGAAPRRAPPTAHVVTIISLNDQASDVQHPSSTRSFGGARDTHAPAQPSSSSASPRNVDDRSPGRSWSFLLVKVQRGRRPIMHDGTCRSPRLAPLSFCQGSKTFRTTDHRAQDTLSRP